MASKGKTFLSYAKRFYCVQSIESKWQGIWAAAQEQQRAGSESSPTFTMILPPPNVTGVLHCGHALTGAVQDAIIRKSAQQGHNVLWVPGVDHAGIATQAVFERRCLAPRGLKRQDLTREEFISSLKEWQQGHENQIKEQLARLGLHLDWAQFYRTLDDKHSKVVTDAFVTLHERGLVYRALHDVNWCPALQTVVSDIEVSERKVTGPGPHYISTPSGRVRVGEMHFVKYTVVSGQSTEHKVLVVGTTRPETIPADIALAVHPNDERYREFIGSYVRVPLHPFRVIKVIADTAVDPNLATGVLKLTPEHSATDRAIAEKHGDLKHLLDAKITAFGPEGRMKLEINERRNMPRLAARAFLVEKLKRFGAYAGSQSCDQVLPVCMRSGDLIEKRAMGQWFVSCRPLAQKLKSRLSSICFTPNVARDQVHEYLDNIHDWCVSRQLWWGHQVPAFYDADSENSWHVGTQKPVGEKGNWVPDPDALDTWFSSCLIPLSAVPPKSYPTSLLETGNDILFFWVTRMAMLCLELRGEVPFKHVMLHGMVRDGQGRKMSKSVGNVIDPLTLINGDNKSNNVPMGADSLRLALLEHSNANVINLDTRRVEYFYYTLRRLHALLTSLLPSTDATAHSGKEADKEFDPADVWLMYHANQLQNECDTCFELTDVQLSRAVRAIETFVKERLYSQFLDVMEHRLNPRTRDPNCVIAVCSALHVLCEQMYPFAPHFSSELKALIAGFLPNDTLLSARAKLLKDCKTYVETFDLLLKAAKLAKQKVQEVRHQATESGYTCTNVVIEFSCSENMKQFLQHYMNSIARASQAHSATLSTLGTKGGNTWAEVSGDKGALIKLRVNVLQKVQVAKASPRASGLSSKVSSLVQLEESIKKTEEMLASTAFQLKAPKEVVENYRKKLARERAALEHARLACQAEENIN